MKDEFENRKKEINTYYAFLENVMEKEARLMVLKSKEPLEIETETEEIEIETGLEDTLKSVCVLLLYNLMEFTVTESIQEIHKAINDEKLTYEQTGDAIQKLWLNQYYEKFKETGNSHRQRLTNLKLMVDKLLKNNIPVNLEFTDKDKRNPNISGNIDARKIKEIANRYGIDFNRSNKSLREIKEKRIELAHGIRSFEDIYAGKTFSKLEKLKEDTFSFLSAFIDSVEKYIDTQSYKS